MGQREALLKERIYWKKGFIERKALLKKKKIGQNLEILTKFGNVVEIVKFGQNCEIWSKLLNLVKIVKFGHNC